MRVPCGQCLECKQARANMWAIRLGHEMEYHDKATFLTLTYHDNNMPPDGSLHKEHWVNFMKKLRKNTTRRYIYYMAGEYGGETDRPHYHALIFGLEPCQKCIQCTKDLKWKLLEPEDGTDCQIVRDTWGQGNVNLGWVTPKSIRYVTGYIKKADGEKPIGGRQLPFSLMSKGIGKQWLKDNATALIKDDGIRRGMKIYNMPKYYQRKLKDSESNTSIIYGWFAEERRRRKAYLSRKEELKNLEQRAIDNHRQLWAQEHSEQKQRHNNHKKAIERQEKMK